MNACFQTVKSNEDEAREVCYSLDTQLVILDTCTFARSLLLSFCVFHFREFVELANVKWKSSFAELHCLLSLFFFVGRGNGGCVSTLKTRKYTYALAQKHVRIHAGPNIRCVINGRLLWLWVLLKHFFDLCISFTIVVSFSIAIEFVCLLLFSVSC